MALKTVVTNLTYKVPTGDYCNLHMYLDGSVSKDKCRFCVKDGRVHRCVLYNMPLEVRDGVAPVRTHACWLATAGFDSEVADEPEVTVEPKVLMKATIDEFVKKQKYFRAQRYPAALVDSLAKEAVLGGK